MGLAARRLSFNVSDISLAVAYDCSDLLEHAEAVITKNCQLDGEGIGNTFLLAPLDINFALRLIHQVKHIRTIQRMHRDSLATSNIPHDILAANRITTPGTIDQQIAMPFNADRIAVVAAEDATHYAADSRVFFGRGLAGVGGRRKFSQYLPR